ncbi:MAG: beta strand repeat-containing protein [Gaiellales bacterium]
MRLGSTSSGTGMRRRIPRYSVLTLAITIGALIVVASQALAIARFGLKVTAHPVAVSRSTSGVFRWKTTGQVLHTVCSLDGKRFAKCRKSKRYTHLRNGRHSFRVRALGPGHTSRTVTVKWRVDTVKPTAPLVTGGSPAWQSVPSITVSASGSTDPGSGLAGYQTRSSADGGTTWSAPVKAAQTTVSTEGETLVQFRAVDRAGNTTAWVPAPGTAGAIARIDNHPPAAPDVTGGSLQWQNATSVDVTASGGSDVGGAGFDHYEYRTSTDSGATWSTPTPGSGVSVSADGETLVQFCSVDAAGNASDWAPAAPDDGSTVRLDRTIPTSPVVTGGTAGWQNIVSTLLTASGSTDAHGAGVAYYQSRTSTDGGNSWSVPFTGNTWTVSAQGQTLVEFRAVDGSNLDSAWTQVPVEIDRTNPTDPTVSGGSANWQRVASIDISASASTDAGGSGLTGYQYETSTDGGTNWSPTPQAGPDALVTTEGETLVRFRAVDGAGNPSNWVQGTARIDRTAPSAPAVNGGSLSWQSLASVDVSASGSADSGGSALDHDEYRTSTVGGHSWTLPSTGGTATISAAGTTVVQFRAADGAGNVSTWAPATPDATDTVKLDHSPPTLSGVSGGSLTWRTSGSVTIRAGTAADTGGSGFSHDEYRTSTDGGTTWVGPTTGSSLTVSDEGETLVQFRAVDVAGNPGAWMPATPGASDTVRIDGTPPTAPHVGGGSLAWQSAASVGISASGSTDSGGSGLAGYQYRTSTDGGHTWSSATSGATATISAQGSTVVQFRALDGAGNQSAWAPAAPDATDTVKLDRTPPTLSGVSGGSLTWRTSGSVTITAGTAADTGGSGFSHDEYRTSTDGGATWVGPTAGSSLTVSAEGQTLVQFRSVDGAGNPSPWVPSTPGGSDTARIDGTPPSAPNVTGGSVNWQSVASITLTASGSTDNAAGVARYEYQTSTDGGHTWVGLTTGSSATISNQGATEIEFRAVDAAGNTSGWVVANATIDRTAPTAPAVAGGSATWQNIASIGFSAAGSTDTGGSGLTGYRYRTSTDNGTTWSQPNAGVALTISGQGQTLVQFESIDNAGNQSPWVQATARIDRTAPAAPTASGGSLNWLIASPITITASATDGQSSILQVNVRTSVTGGLSWVNQSPLTAAPYNYLATAQGTTLVQFQAVDQAGNASAWGPASAGAGNTAKLDTVPPSLPTVSGGQGATTCRRWMTVRASGSTDVASGFAHYDYRLSTNNSVTWGSPVLNASSVTLRTKGTYVVQFRADDKAGNMSAWAPATAGTANTACIS